MMRKCIKSFTEIYLPIVCVNENSRVWEEVRASADVEVFRKTFWEVLILPQL